MMRTLAGVALVVAWACGGTADNKTPVRVALTGFGGLEYTAPITIGGQPFNALTDTGSTTTAVAGVDCLTCPVSPRYMPGSGAVDTNQMATTTYGDNSTWTGEVFTDKAGIGSAPAVSVDFASMTTETGFFRTNEFQAVLGLGPDDLLAPHTTSLADAEFASGLDAQLAFELCNDHGALFIGGYDDTVTSAPPVYTPMLPIGNTEPFYAIRLGGLAIGSATVAASGLGTPIVDTGTSLSYVPTAAFNALLGAITASPGFTSQFAGQGLTDGGCVLNSAATAATVDAALPPLALTVDGASQPIMLAASRSYLVDEGGGMFCLGLGDAGALGQGSGFGVVGDSLMAGTLTVFDLANSRIGFAPDIGCSAAGSGSAVRPFAATAASPYFRPPPRLR
jgi:hypothetical protein